MSAYRFCRTDDIGLLVDALNRCWLPCAPGEPPVTAAAFKRAIHDLQVWCSSCMVAFSGADPVGVLIGAKRRSGTLIHRIAVHSDHRRQGHGRHLLDSLSAKLAILGPPRLVAEVPEASVEASALFETVGYVEETVLTDYVLDPATGPELRRPSGTDAGNWVIPFTVDDLAANGFLDTNYPPTCWERSVETLMACKEEISGLAVASDERIEAYLLYRRDEIVALRSSVEDRGDSLNRLLSRLPQTGARSFRLPRVHPGEIPAELLEGLGFRATGVCRFYGATARGQ